MPAQALLDAHPYETVEHQRLELRFADTGSPTMLPEIQTTSECLPFA